MNDTVEMGFAGPNAINMFIPTCVRVNPEDIDEISAEFGTTDIQVFGFVDNGLLIAINGVTKNMIQKPEFI